MDKDIIQAQISNAKTSRMYYEQCTMLAENVFKLDIKENENVDTDLLDMGFVNEQLVSVGEIAWFVDEVMGLLALPFSSMSSLDVYGNPIKIQVIGQNGYRRILNRGEFVIMYDNTKKICIKNHIKQFSERLALATRVIDINLEQQKTPRVWKTTSEKQKSLETLLNKVEAGVNAVAGFEDILTDDMECVIAPAPFVSDKVDQIKDKIWNEYMRFIGISNLSVQKKERLISNEVQTSQGGTIASRFNRYDSRLDAIKKIKKYFGIEIELSFYDGLPTTLKDERGDANEYDSNISDDSDDTDSIGETTNSI